MIDVLWRPFRWFCFVFCFVFPDSGCAFFFYFFMAARIKRNGNVIRIASCRSSRRVAKKRSPELQFLFFLAVFFFFVVVFHSDAQVERQPSVDMAEMTEKQVEIAKCSFFFFGLRLSDSSWCV